jgi:lipopolysaccharide biosynthesis regulator YciM
VRDTALLDRAETIARSITTSGFQNAALRALLEALVEAGDLDKAETVARSITDPSDRARALSELSKALVAIGALERAEAMIRSISAPGVQAPALMALLAKLPPDKAQQVFVAALTTTDPVGLLDIAAVIAPLATVEVVEHFYSY